MTRAAGVLLHATISAMDDTLHWYSENAEDFADRTAGIDCMVLYNHFLPRIPAGGSILDAGCGSGRDARYFLEAGYRVHAMDAVPEIAEQARRLTGLDVEVCRFGEFRSTGLFDGIWACASLLHVAGPDLPRVASHLAGFLKPGGVFYMSFKYGKGERARGPRFFTDLDEAGLERLAAALPGMELSDSWITEDRRPDRKNERWMNAVFEKMT